MIDDDAVEYGGRSQGKSQLTLAAGTAADAVNVFRFADTA